MFWNSKDYESVQPTEPPLSKQPTISVVISSPVIQIIDVGETIRLPCNAYNVVKQVSAIKSPASGARLCWWSCIVKLDLFIGLSFLDSDHSHLAQARWTSSGPCIPTTRNTHHFECSTFGQWCLRL